MGKCNRNCFILFLFFLLKICEILGNRFRVIYDHFSPNVRPPLPFIHSIDREARSGFYTHTHTQTFKKKKVRKFVNYSTRRATIAVLKSAMTQHGPSKVYSSPPSISLLHTPLPPSITRSRTTRRLSRRWRTARKRHLSIVLRSRLEILEI